MTARGSHAMPFGATVEADGVRFRLWAPAAGSVHLLLDGASARVLPMRARVLPMRAMEEGWFETKVEAEVGTRYRFRIDQRLDAPDPASRHQPQDVLGPSAVVDPGAYVWRHDDWTGRAWGEAVFYELHIGAFTPEGSFKGARRRLPYLAELGVTALQIMPISDFSGARNWGYDGVLPFAPDSAYGTPDSLKRLVDDAHGFGLMVFLDVVYNHFGPEGNFLGAYAPSFFTNRFQTPWGQAIDFSQRQVRDFFIHNALYWLEEYRFDGLRLDAVHAIEDESATHFLDELADAVHQHFAGRRRVHLVLEDDENEAHLLSASAGAGYRAQWNDDFHHACHVLATGEAQSYYSDHAADPVGRLIRCLSEGFAYQGEPSAHRGGRGRGEASRHLPSTAFVNFLQNHDQIGNRAFGERLAALAAPEALKALTAILLLAPSPPMLFMGQEWGARQPFLYFCDFRDDLAAAVREGRRREFQAFPAFRDEAARSQIPDPNAATTFAAACLDWSAPEKEPHAQWLRLHSELLRIRHREIAPRLAKLTTNTASAERLGDAQFQIVWRLDGDSLCLRANLADAPAQLPALPARARILYAQDEAAQRRGEAAPWSVVWSLG
jgi:malto-oligosyltrehalose trehalohydrolase